MRSILTAVFATGILLFSFSAEAQSSPSVKTTSMSYDACVVGLSDALTLNTTSTNEICQSIENQEQMGCYIYNYKKGWTNLQYGIKYCKAKWHPSVRETQFSKCYVIIVDGLVFNSDVTTTQCSSYPSEIHAKCYVEKFKAGWTNADYLNNYCKSYAKMKSNEVPPVSQEELQYIVRLPLESSLTIQNELYVPSEVGCAATKNGVSGVQCFACLNQKLKNDFLFPESSIPAGFLIVAGVEMAEDRKSLNISINENQTRISRIYCRSERPIDIRKQTDLTDILTKNDIKVTMPPAVVYQSAK